MSCRDTKNTSRLIFLICMILLSGCSAAPEVTEVRGVIIQHFEKRGYHVSELDIEKITNIPIKDREYMSTKGHLVIIRTINLQQAGQAAGGVATFSEAVIEIHKSPDELIGWVVTRITGIPVQ